MSVVNSVEVISKTGFPLTNHVFPLIVPRNDKVQVQKMECAVFLILRKYSQVNVKPKFNGR